MKARIDAHSPLRAPLTPPVSRTRAAAVKAPIAPAAHQARAVGATIYGGAAATASTGAKTLGSTSAIYGAQLSRQLAEEDAELAAAKKATLKLDALIGKIGASADREAGFRSLQKLLGELGPEVVAKLPGDGAPQGIEYVNAKLRAFGADRFFEPVMDAVSQWAVKLGKPGELRGTAARISFRFAPYSEGTLRFLASKGVPDRGMWAVTFEGKEAFAPQKNEDGSTSAKVRDLRRSANGGDLDEVLSTFVSMIREQPLPPGYRLEIDLEGVPTVAANAARAALGALKDHGAELAYLETDPTKIMAAAMDRLALAQRIDALVSKPRASWSPAEQAEYLEVFRLYQEQPARRFESP